MIVLPSQARQPPSPLPFPPTGPPHTGVPTGLARAADAEGRPRVWSAHVRRATCLGVRCTVHASCHGVGGVHRVCRESAVPWPTGCGAIARQAEDDYASKAFEASMGALVQQLQPLVVAASVRNWIAVWNHTMAQHGPPPARPLVQVG
jgi:hypothetical protein